MLKRLAYEKDIPYCRHCRAADIIKNWIRNRSTIEYLGTWEMVYNPNFKVVEFDHFKKEAGLPTFTLSVSNWVEKKVNQRYI